MPWQSNLANAERAHANLHPMKITLTATLALALVARFAGQSPAEEPTRSANSVDARLQAIVSKSGSVEVTALERERKELIDGLVKIVRASDDDASSRWRKLRAVRLLKEYRAVEAVDCLIDNVALNAGFSSEIGPLAGFEAAWP